MIWVCGHYIFSNSFSAGTVSRRHNLTSVDVRFKTFQETYVNSLIDALHFILPSISHCVDLVGADTLINITMTCNILI